MKALFPFPKEEILSLQEVVELGRHRSPPAGLHDRQAVHKGASSSLSKEAFMYDGRANDDFTLLLSPHSLQHGLGVIC